MDFVNDHQIQLILLFFISGTVGTVVLFRRRVTRRAWRIADLVWVCLGGVGALVAVAAGIYKADSSRLDRQIDLAYAATTAFDRDAARFRLAHCEADHPDPALAEAIRTLCGKVEFLSASTARNSGLPLFVAITGRAAPLTGLRLFGRSGDGGMGAELAQFDDRELLAFAAEDEATRAAVLRLRAGHDAGGIAAEYQVIAGAYGDLIADLTELRGEWLFLRSHAGILSLQVVALCLVAFAAPFRIGKSVADLV